VGIAGAAAAAGLAAGLRAAGLAAAGLAAAGFAAVAGFAGVAAGAACADGEEEEGHGDVAWASAAVEAAVPRTNASANVEPKRITSLPLNRHAQAAASLLTLPGLSRTIHYSGPDLAANGDQYGAAI
jgi:hypothetical protein